MYLSDAYFNPLTNLGRRRSAWSVSALLSITGRRPSTRTLRPLLAASTGAVRTATNCDRRLRRNRRQLSPKALSWLVGADLGWNPVTNLNFDLEVMYQSTHQDQPSGFIGTVLQQWPRCPGRLAGAPATVSGPSAHHPLLLIRVRSAKIQASERKLRGLFLCRGENSTQLGDWTSRTRPTSQGGAGFRANPRTARAECRPHASPFIS